MNDRNIDNRPAADRVSEDRLTDVSPAENRTAEQVTHQPVRDGHQAHDAASLHRLLAGMKDLRDGNFRRRLVVAGDGLPAELATVFNEIAERNQRLAGEMTRVRVAVGKDEHLDERVNVGSLRGGADSTVGSVRANVDDLASDASDGWAFAAAAMNGVIDDLLRPTTELSRVLAAAAEGDLSPRMTGPPAGSRPQGELGSLSTSVNSLLERLSAFADEVTRVAREVGTEGRLGGQAEVPGVAGTWRDLTDSVNFMAGNLTNQVRNIAQVTTAVARGDLTQKINVDARGEVLELKNTINTMVDQLSDFADEVTRVAREVGTEGKLGGQAHVPGAAGTWRDLTHSVNFMADNLTGQVRNIAQVATAVARGDLTQKINVDARGEILELKNTINTMLDQLSDFADEVTRVAREVGTEGILGGQARVRNVAGTWKDLTDNVNFMAGNLTSQVRNIAQVATALARGDLTQKIDVDARGEILALKNTINTTVDRLSAFASEVTRVAREVGTEGKLGGQAEVEGVSGTWQRLTANVNRLASNLTTQVRAIATVSTAVTRGDLTQQITVDASGEILELKNNINQMIANLEETTRANLEQDWLKTNLARLSALMQGHRDVAAMASLILSELAPLVSAQQGAFFLARSDEDGALERIASYGTAPDGMPSRFRRGESLVGQAAVDKKTILIGDAPANYFRISSGLGTTAPGNVIVLPLLFEGEPLGVIELASVNPFSPARRDLLEQLTRNIGVNVNTLLANTRTEILLTESQRLAQELRARSEQLQAQQDELQRSNTELAQKASQLARQNRDIEVKNTQIELARQEIEERARQLSMASKYKSEFMANMSHELRTPLNSALILAQMLAENIEGTLTPKQIEYSQTIESAVSDLLELINDILDLAKVEAGYMDLRPDTVPLERFVTYVETLCRPLVAEKGLEFSVSVAPELPATIQTDPHRLQQILRNLLSNAVKFTDSGSVGLSIRAADEAEVTSDLLREAPARIAFAVQDTGVGIPADKIEVIFEAFRQADGTTSRRYGGTGLGLTISRELAHLLDGELHVTSEQDVGSTFVLYLPLYQEPPAVPTLGPPAAADRPAARDGEDTPATIGHSNDPGPDIDIVAAPPPAAVASLQPSGVPPVRRMRLPEPRFHGEKVLIVDDDQRNVYAMTRLLERHGLRVVGAENAETGLQTLMRDRDIALVLMDIMMPGLDGHGAVAKIRSDSRYPNLPIIAVTAKAMREDRERSLACGATDHVTKPVDVHRLFHLLSQHLPASGRQPEP